MGKNKKYFMKNSLVKRWGETKHEVVTWRNLWVTSLAMQKETFFFWPCDYMARTEWMD
jgi:hypothetical protein